MIGYVDHEGVLHDGEYAHHERQARELLESEAEVAVVWQREMEGWNVRVCDDYGLYAVCAKGWCRFNLQTGYRYIDIRADADQVVRRKMVSLLVAQGDDGRLASVILRERLSLGEDQSLSFEDTIVLLKSEGRMSFSGRSTL